MYLRVSVIYCCVLLAGYSSVGTVHRTNTACLCVCYIEMYEGLVSS